MSTEDNPPAPKSVAHSGLIVVQCAARCGASDRVPSYNDRSESDPARRIKPVALPPYICLACWLDGWRSEGPNDAQNNFRIYHLNGKALPNG